MSLYLPDSRQVSVSAYYALPLTQFQLNSHVHDRCEIMYVAAGSCSILLDREELRLRERQFVFLDGNVPHGLRVERGSPCTLLNLEFGAGGGRGGVDLRELADSCGDFRAFLRRREEFLLLHDSRKVGYALKDLIAELDGKEQADPYLLRLLFQRLLVEVAKCTGEGSRFTGVLHLKKAVRFIGEHIYEPLTVPRIAEHVGVNHSYLQSLFSMHMHMGVMAYVIGLRMDHASFLLKNSSMGVTDLAFHLGFNSRQHFGYTFEKAFGMSPRQYRRLHGQNIQTDTGGAQWQRDEHGGFSAVSLGQE